MDYRNSHVSSSHALSYHNDFAGNPYRAMMWRLEQEAVDEIVKKFLAGNHNVTHMDFACGTGRIVGHLSKQGFASVGVDVSDAMLDIARENNPTCEYIKADLTSDDVLAGRKFDLITAFRFFANAQDELRASGMQAIAERLSPNGVLVFNNHKNHTSSLYRLARVLGRKDRTLDSGQVRDLLSANGLQVVAMRHIGVFPSADRLRLLPARMLQGIERVLSGIPVLAHFASNHIYVCKFVNAQERV